MMFSLDSDEFVTHRSLFDLCPDNVLLRCQAAGVANLGNFLQAHHQVENFLGQAFIAVQVVELRVGGLDFGGDFAPGAVGAPLGALCLQFGNFALEVAFSEPGDVLHQGVARAANTAGGQGGAL